MLYAGSLVFSPPAEIVDTSNFTRWWQFLKGADWRHPYGPGSNIHGLDDHPVVHIAYGDALAHMRHGRARTCPPRPNGNSPRGLEGAEYAWGDELTPDGRHMANTWQGIFPNENLALDGYERTSPVGSYPPGGYGLYDMIGNVWEWTADWFSARHQPDPAKPCCIPKNPRGGQIDGSLDPAMPQIRIPRKVLKGGSHLCTPSLLQALPPRRPPCRSGRRIDQAIWDFAASCATRSRIAAPGSTPQDWP